MNTDSTICAVSTPYGVGGISVVRISGQKAIDIVDKLFRGKHRLSEAKTHTLLFGEIHRQGEMLDQCVVSLFRAPHSFTGEDVVEISVHGSLYIQNELINCLIDEGCEPARAGEFTQRAFLNGKLDLSEAEAVADLIASESKAQHDLALNQLRGGISKELQQLRNRLLQFTSLIELELDFADHEDLEFADRTELQTLVIEIKEHLERLIGSFRAGNAIKNGVPVAIVGATNAGKSTLLNSLVGEQRAIVSTIHGTTRDTIEETLNIQGVHFRIIDTAGIRQTDNEIEAIGIQRSREAAEKADIILWVVDSADKDNSNNILEGIDTKDKTVITLYNKVDLLTEDQQKQLPTDNEHSLAVSAKNGNLANLTNLLLQTYSQHFTQQKTIISNARHYEALKRALTAIMQVQQGLRDELSGELLTLDLHDCLQALGEITGEISSQEVLNNIFAKFCIGK